MKSDNRDLTDTREIGLAFERAFYNARSVFFRDNYTDSELDFLIRDLRYLLAVAEGK